MSDFVGGYILFPTTQQRSDVIMAILQAMELPLSEVEIKLPDEGETDTLPEDSFPTRTLEPPERALEELALVQGGAINAKGPTRSEIFWFESMLPTYHVINLWVSSTKMYYGRNAEYVENLVTRWLQLCEQGNATFGYFSPFEHMFDRDYLEEQFLPSLKRNDAPFILQKEDALWLIYLGPELAQRWREEKIKLPFKPLVSQELPSGAHFFRTTKEVFG